MRKASNKYLVRKNTAGMAIMVVLSIASVLLLLGLTYLKSFSQSTVTGKLQLDQIQADFFARGIQNIALFKVKRYPDFFLRAYRYKIYQDRLAAGEVGLDPPIAPPVVPPPFSKFTGIYLGHERDILNNIPDATDNLTEFTKPIRVATYSTQFSLLSADDFKRGFIEITVNLQLEGKDIIGTYKMSLDASQTARL